MPFRRPSSQVLAFLALLTMTAAWGSTFFMIKDVVTRLGVLDLLTVRFGIAALVLAVIAGRQLRMGRRTLLRGVGLGGLYGVAQILQTTGLAHTAASVSGFITGLYVVATPLLGALILRSRIPALTWVAAGLATLGLGVLSLNGFSMGYGEVLTLVSAIIYAGHIIALGRLSEPGSALSLSVVQTATIAVICGLAAVWPSGGSGFGIQLPGSRQDWLIVIYLAVIAGAMTMVLQTWAQARVDPSRAAVIMAMEPVWAAGFAVALGGERITGRMIIGGLAILAAMYLGGGPTATPQPGPGRGWSRRAQGVRLMITERRAARGPIPPGRPSETTPTAVTRPGTWRRARGGRRDPPAPSGREVAES